MSAYVLSSEAYAELYEIWSYISGDSMHHANRVEAEILESRRMLAEYPHAGHRRTDITTLPFLFWTSPRYPNYTIVYRAETQPLAIVHVMLGARDLKALLG